MLGSCNPARSAEAMCQSDSSPHVASYPPSRIGFQDFDHGATDLVSAAEFNGPGTHLAVCSTDHSIRVFTQDYRHDWTLLDHWRGHDAEILDVKWIGHTLGSVFGTIGDDAKVKVWREDCSQAPQSGHRFRCIFSQSSANRVSYVSLGFKTVRHEVCMAIVQSDGLLALLEPSDPGSLNFSKELDSAYPYGQYNRGSEPTFKLSLHQAARPSYHAISAGVDPKAISIALSAASSIKILRATRTEDGDCKFYQVLEIEGVASVINDVSWAPGCIRSCDLIAAACNDGHVRVFEVITPHHAGFQSPTMSSDPRPLTRDRGNSSKLDRHAPSGIGAGLAGVSRAKAMHESSGATRIQQSWRETAVLVHGRGLPVWRVRWTHDGNFSKAPCDLTLTYGSLGSTIASTGDCGKLQLWKQNLDGHFVEFAETRSV
ncbi:MAG: hypothetical protein LQ339_008247 [Xanthoria mediterranea]|nr:MAG: hypothetical protein LQ339_008247 [Xanthoria mediterranea]